MDFVVMGVSGCGKSTIARRLCEYLNAEFLEGDDHHPAANISKMSSGEALTDKDRAPWLNDLAKLMREKRNANQPFVLSCSALKKEYREILSKNNEITFVYLKGSEQEITARLQNRKNHFMPTDLIRSQFSVLEEPTAKEQVITVSVEQSINAMITEITSAIENS